MGAGSEVFNHLVGLEDIAANLVAPADFAFIAVEAFHFGAFFVLKFLEETRLQGFHGGGFIFVLRAFVLAGDDDVGGEVGDADCGFGFVDVLSATAA